MTPVDEARIFRRRTGMRAIWAGVSATSGIASTRACILSAGSGGSRRRRGKPQLGIPGLLAHLEQQVDDGHLVGEVLADGLRLLQADEALRLLPADLLAQGPGGPGAGTLVHGGFLLPPVYQPVGQDVNHWHAGSRAGRSGWWGRPSAG